MTNRQIFVGSTKFPTNNNELMELLKSVSDNAIDSFREKFAVDLEINSHDDNTLYTFEDIHKKHIEEFKNSISII